MQVLGNGVKGWEIDLTGERGQQRSAGSSQDNELLLFGGPYRPRSVGIARRIVDNFASPIFDGWRKVEGETDRNYREMQDQARAHVIKSHDCQMAAIFLSPIYIIILSSCIYKLLFPYTSLHVTAWTRRISLIALYLLSSFALCLCLAFHPLPLIRNQYSFVI